MRNRRAGRKCPAPFLHQRSAANFAGRRKDDGRKVRAMMNRCIKCNYVNKNRKKEEVETPVTEFYKKWKFLLKVLVSKEKASVENHVDNVYNLL